jgi:hypothetical protein
LASCTAPLSRGMNNCICEKAHYSFLASCANRIYIQSTPRHTTMISAGANNNYVLAMGGLKLTLSTQQRQKETRNTHQGSASYTHVAINGFCSDWIVAAFYWNQVSYLCWLLTYFLCRYNFFFLKIDGHWFNEIIMILFSIKNEGEWNN